MPAVGKIICRTAAARVYVPLAVGTHIDHRLTFAAGRGLKGVAFYEDRPYAFLAASVRMRLAEIGARIARLPRRAAPKTFLESLDRTAYVRAYLGGRERGDCISEWLSRLRTPSARDGPALRPEVVRSGPKEFERICAVVNEHASQVGDLFGGDYRRCALEYAARLGVRGYAERYWILLDKPMAQEYTVSVTPEEESP